MAEDFDPYYLWLAIPPSEQPANHYRLLGVPLFEENPGVIESAADRQMAHLRSVQAGKHSALSQRLLNEVAAAKVCLLRAPQKARYDQALRLKLQPAAPPAAAPPPAAPSPSAAQSLPKAAAQARPAAAMQTGAASSNSEGFWEDVTGSAGSQAVAKASKPKPTVAPAQKMKLWPIALVAGACLLVAVVVVIKASSGSSDEPKSNDTPTVPAIVAKPKESLLVFDWSAEDRAGLTLTVDGAKVVGPPSGSWEFHCLAGPHRVIASRAGFKPIDIMVDAPADSKRKITDAWTPLATLALNWPIENRDGAVLNVDGQNLQFGTDQPLVLPVEPGTHTVRVTRAGYQSFEKNITVAVNSQQEFPIGLRATPATLIVRWPVADRASAELRIDGRVRPLGNGGNAATVVLALTPGTHEVFIFRPGFRPFTQSISLAAADRKLISPTWTALPSLPPANVANTNSATGPKVSDAGSVATAPLAKRPIPTAVDQQRVSKQLDEIYKPTHDAAKDLAQAKELSDLAAKAEDMTERYMLYLKAADFAVEGGDLSSALQAIDSLDAEFAIASIDAKEKILEKFVKGPSNADQITDAVNTAMRLIDDAMAADRYETATAAIALAGKFLVKKSVDPDFRRDSEKLLGTYRAKIKAIMPLWEAAQAAKKTLDSKPDDADANTTLGRWYCFYKGDWSHGLPYCVKSGNDRLKPVAELELKSPSDANQKVAVADQWWDIGQKETGPAADSIHLHAGDLYRSAMPDLNSVLKKAAVEKRLAEVTELRSRIGDAAGGQHTGPVVFQRGRWVNVLKLIDVARDHASGNWTRHGAEITGEPGVSQNPRINLPIALDGGYDLQVDFTRTNGAGEVHTIFSIGKQICGFTLNAGSYNGYDSINGRTLYDYYQNPYALTGFRLQNGHRYQEIISVRLLKGGAASVDVALDGKQFLPHLEGDPALLGVDTRYLAAPKQPTIDLGYGSTVTLNAVRLRMVSGQGHSETAAADSSESSGSDSGTPAKRPAGSPSKTKVSPNK